MVKFKPILSNDKLWVEKILRVYWLLVLMVIVGQTLGLLITIFYEPTYVETFILYKLVIPSYIQTAILLFAHYLIKVKKVYSSYFITTIGTLIALVVVAVHPNVSGLKVIFLIAMAVILIYFDKKLLQFSFAFNFITLTALYAVPDIRQYSTIYEYFSYHFVLLAGFLIYQIILDRGTEVLDFLNRAAEKEKALIVKSTVMERLSKTDLLTGLYNHNTFHEYLDFLYEQSISQAMPLQLALIDIDSFKMINDHYGHDVGDIVLKRVAHAISDQLTEDDIVARYGGEEFAVLLTNKEMEESYQIIENIRLYIASQYHQELNEHITISIGFCGLAESMTKDQFFKETDELLYQAKGSGKNQVIGNQLINMNN
ncbi:GGDEF domain-containing protein [Gracilibacillus caseinilyticus]|uniref:GGDEF domain-containing protein n=1 Tax=Gracilibacillus caseinilyticus TaxID=2932256 RepID=A0ABY4EZV6_9BACI|nr:GGDEF domain-containing protein [Gracilibacillus caseinilyticus]UOQ49930.1 GGDEF domain-containing protein [Gracilibacillus caseinilyticus]